jgi:FkbM family methyltransferase
MRNEFCTLFDVNYLPRGLVLYRSLAEHCDEFRLRVYCVDRETKDVLDGLALPHLETIGFDELERDDPELLAVKSTRTRVEYCWTATPAICLHALHRDPGLEQITYLDADLMFYADPAPIFNELGHDSILIVPHRYANRWDQGAAVSGIYNVQFLTFKRDERGLEALDWWHERCIEWCFARFEDGKLGDQKYLDDWPERFAGVHVLEHPGGGLAPWNVESYVLTGTPEAPLVDGVPLVFFHYHSLRLHRGVLALLRRLGIRRGDFRAGPAGFLWITSYPVPALERDLIWDPYLRALGRAYEDIRRIQPSFASGFVRPDVAPAARRAVAVFVSRVRGVLRRRLMRRPTVEVATALGSLKVELPHGFEGMVAGDGYEPALVTALQRLVGQGFVCADVGANVGVLTLYLAQSVGESGKVIAFEPVRENAALLRRNVRRNRLESRVTIEQVAVTDGVPPMIQLFPARWGTHAEWTISHEFASREDGIPVERRPIRVAAVSLDSYFPPGSRLDLVKMDIEGAEPQAIAGMRRILADAQPLLVLEFHREVGWPAIPALLQAGYTLEALDGTPLPIPEGPDDVPYQLVARPNVSYSSS